MSERVAVFAPNLTLTVTIDRAGKTGSDEVHLHPGGQGFWIARMLAHLGFQPSLVGPVGGEPGKVLESLVPLWHVDLHPIEANNPSAVIVQDRRSGDREVLTDIPTADLNRHTSDDAYTRFLEVALDADVAVITGQSTSIVNEDTYRRMAHDLSSAEVKVVGDLHGGELLAYLDGGPIEILKVSDEDLAADHLLNEGSEETHLEAIQVLHGLGARGVVLSRAEDPTLAYLDGRFYRAIPTPLEPADFRGAGDSMTAGLVAAVARGMAAEDTLRLACGAGGANVARHGLGSGSQALITGLAERVKIEDLGQDSS